MSTYFRQFLNELSRRGLLKVGGLYLASAWVLIQVADVTLIPLGLPAWVFNLLIWLVVIGFPFTLALTWRYDISLDGISLTPPSEEVTDDRLSLSKGDFVALLVAMLFISVLTVYVAGHLREQQTRIVGIPPEILEIPDQSIAVLPFENLSGDPAQSHFGKAFTIEITTGLSKFSNLLVIGSHSIFSLTDLAMTNRELSRELGVRYLMSGTVQHESDRLRINVQLMEAPTGRNIWAERYDRNAKDLFVLKTDLIDAVVAALALQISAEERQRAVQKDAANLQARDYYLRGVAAQPCETDSECRDNFEKAYELAPDHARTLGWLSYVLRKGYVEGWEGYSENELLRAHELAHRAVELDPDDYQNHWSLAMVYLTLRDYQKGMAAYDRALLLNDNDPDLLVEMAEQLVYQGRHLEALEQIQRGMRLNPIYPDWYLHDLGWVLYFLKEYEQSIAVINKMIMRPRAVNSLMAANYAQLRQSDNARREIKEYLKKRPGWSISREREAEFFRDSRSEQHWLDGLRKAGLPE